MKNGLIAVKSPSINEKDHIHLVKSRCPVSDKSRAAISKRKKEPQPFSGTRD